MCDTYCEVSGEFGTLFITKYSILDGYDQNSHDISHCLYYSNDYNPLPQKAQRSEEWDYVHCILR